jgi:transposase-like protein
MFQDEARFGRINDVRRCWAPKPLSPLCQSMLTHEYTYVYGAVDVCTGELDSLTLPHVNTQCMQLFLNKVSARHSDERIVMVIDGAGWHRSDALKAPDNIYLLKLPRMHASSIRSNMSSMSCVRSSFITASSGDLMHWRIT